MADEGASFGGIWDEVGEVYHRHSTTLAGATSVLVLIDLLTNLLASERVVNTIGNVISLIAAFLIMFIILRADRLIEHEGRAPGYFLVTVLSGFGIVIGLIALLVPGLYLLARWSLAQPLTITRNRGAIAAMRESWHLTQSHVWTLVGVFLSFGLAAGIILISAVFLAGRLFSNPATLSAIGLVSVVTNAILVTAVCLSVAIYRRIVSTGSTVAAVFE